MIKKLSCDKGSLSCDKESPSCDKGRVSCDKGSLSCDKKTQLIVINPAETPSTILAVKTKQIQ